MTSVPASCSPDEPPNDEVEIAADELAEQEGPERRRFVVGRSTQRRIDSYLQQRLKGVSRSRVQKLIDLGGVSVNDSRPKASTVVRSGDVIDVILPPQAVRVIHPEPIPLDVLYEDDHFIVVNKQANLIVHPARSNLSGTLINALAHHFKLATERRGGNWSEWRTRGYSSQQGRRVGPVRSADLGDEGSEPVPGLSGVGVEECRPGIIHRLDKNTTGVMVVAKRDEAHWQIARQFEDRSTTKAYLAVVHGRLDPQFPGGVIDAPIGKHPTIREAYAVRHDPAGKPSCTIYRVRERYFGYTLVELELKTGRTHQIRVHMQYIGHPIVGDIVYGGEAVGPVELAQPPNPAGSRRLVTFARPKDEGDRLQAQADERRQRGEVLLCTPALHAGYLRFVHPGTGDPVVFTAALHAPMLELVNALRRHAGRADPHHLRGSIADSGCYIDLRVAAPIA